MNRLDAIDRLKACEAELAALRAEHYGELIDYQANLDYQRSRVESAESTLAALRAQVAGEGWRPAEDAPALTRVDIRGSGKKSLSGQWIVDVKEWLPAPPKETTP